MFPFLQMASTTEFLILFGLVGLFLIIVFWLGSGDDPVKEKIKQNKRDNNIIEEFNEFRKGPYGLADQKFKYLLDSFAEEVPICSKCRSNKFQFWLFTEGTIEVRCRTCKRKQQFYQEDIETGIPMLYQAFEDYYRHCYRWVTWSDKVSNPVLEVLSWGIDVKVNQEPYIRIVFEAKGKLKETTKRSRRITQDVMDRVWRRDEGKCVKCGSQENLEFDHMVPFSKNGSNSYRNIQLLCEPCNRSKSAKIG